MVELLTQQHYMQFSDVTTPQFVAHARSVIVPYSRAPSMEGRSMNGGWSRPQKTDRLGH